MAKLYPPNIEGTIPAFTGTTLVVPFSMNLAVPESEIHAIVIKVKKVNSNDILLTKETRVFQLSSECKAFFYLNEGDKWEPQVGQFYRVQIAYKNKNNEIGYFSSVGVIKYTTEPTVSLLEVTDMAANLHKYSYTAVYNQLGDSTEKLYSMQMKLIDSQDKVVYDSGEVIHSVINDVLPYQAIEKFEINQDLKINETHRVILKATSVNGISVVSPKYRIVQRENTSLMFEDIKLIERMKATSNFDEGSITVTLKPYRNGEYRLSGTFVLSRSENTAVHNWSKLKKFFLRTEDMNKFKFTDYTIEQGKTYIYSLQQYNNYDIYSNRIISNEIYADFEDMYLLDGERQLKIRFNPKVSSMKDNIVESKVNTIGARYPFITRNGHVNHKEFSLSGLISYQMDDNRNFMGWNDLGIEQNITDLISENIQAEREFKLEVLKWLNDGKPKIFKSPVEGNYIVRLMGVSLSPTDTVGRMLHSFNCTATEIAPFNYISLDKYQFIDTSNADNSIFKWHTILCAEKNSKTGMVEYKKGELLQNGKVAYAVHMYDMLPGTIIYINGEKLVIGATGSYSATMSVPITSIVIPEDHNIKGSIDIKYKDIFFTEFDKIRKITLKEIPCLQIIGNPTSDKITNIIESLRDVKTEILNISKVRFTKRNKHKIYVQYSKGQKITPTTPFYYDGAKVNNDVRIQLNELNPLELYEIYYSQAGLNIIDDNGVIKYVDEENNQIIPNTGLILDLYNNPNGFINLSKFQDVMSLYEIRMDYITGYDKITQEPIIKTEYMSVEDIEDFISTENDFHVLAIGDGVIAELTLSEQIVDYSYEFEHPKVIGFRENYDRVLEEYMSDLITLHPTPFNDMVALKNVKTRYKELIDILTITLAEDYTVGG